VATFASSLPDTHPRHLADNPTARESRTTTPDDPGFPRSQPRGEDRYSPQPLTTTGVPNGDDPEIADIGYYAPSRDLVLYYGDVGYWNGIVRIGQFDSDQLALVQTRQTASTSPSETPDLTSKDGPQPDRAGWLRTTSNRRRWPAGGRITVRRIGRGALRVHPTGETSSALVRALTLMSRPTSRGP